MSAGGIEPLQKLFQSLSPTTGMAFVVIHHLRSQPPTHLHQLLTQWTSMLVHVVQQDARMKPNEVYIIPSGREMRLTDGALELKPRSKIHGWTNVVSLFIDSLRRSQHCGIAVILSGMDENGSEALRAFRDHGGITIAQQPETATQRGMPDAAIRSGAVDYILPPDDIAAQLEKIASTFASDGGPHAPWSSSDAYA